LEFLLVGRRWQELDVLPIRTELRLKASIMRRTSEIPMNIFIVNQEILSAWSSCEKISGV